MECTDNATFNHRPKAVNGVCMKRTAYIFSFTMMDNAMIEIIAQ